MKPIAIETQNYISRGSEYNVANKAVSVLFMLVLFRYTFINLILQIGKMVPIVGGLTMAFFVITVSILSFLSLPLIMKCITIQDIIFVLFFILIYFLSFTNERNVEYLYDRLFNTFLVNLPLLFVGMSVSFNMRFFRKRNYSVFDVIYALSIFSVLVSTLYQMFYANTGRTEDFGISQVSTAILPCACIIIYKTLNELKIYQICISAIAVVHLLTLGIRMPLLCIAALVIVMAVQKSNWKIRLILIISGAVFLLIGAGALDFIMDYLYSLSIKLGVTTRIFDYFNQGDILTLNFREQFFNGGIQAIKVSPIIGNGLFGDRYYCYGGYCHNLFIELVAHLGMILGFLSIIALVYVTICAVKYTDRSSSLLCIEMALLCSVFLNLLISGSYIEDEKFFLTIGIMLQGLRTYYPKTNIRNMRK